MRRRAGDGCKESSGPRFHRPPRPCDTKVSQGGPEAPPRLRSVDLTTQRAKEKIADSLGTLEAQLRVLGVRTASWVRLVGGLAFLSFAFAFGVLGGRPGWRMVLAPITGYCVLVLLGTVVLRRRGWRWAALPLFVALDLGACFACHLLPLPVTANPAALASLGLGSFVLVVVLASFTVTSAAQLYAAALLAAAAQAVLLHKVGAEPEMVAAASLTLAAVGVLAAFGVRRLQELAARLVAEEAHRGLATEKGLQLERANGQIALINAELEEQHQRLVIAQREAEVLASLLVHDMKQPLSSVLALLELSAAEVAQLGGSAPLQRDLEMAREQSERLLAMIGDLLAISRLEKGQLEPKPAPLQIGALLADVVRRAPRTKARLSVVAADDLVVHLDRELTERMVENLLSNALSFAGPAGAVELSALQSGGELVLSVKNDGPPVSIARRKGLFEKLVPDGVHRHNAGLGLYLCRLVAEAHRGRIGLETDPRFAVAFVVRLPALQAWPAWKAIA